MRNKMPTLNRIKLNRISANLSFLIYLNTIQLKQTLKIQQNRSFIHKNFNIKFNLVLDIYFFI